MRMYFLLLQRIILCIRAFCYFIFNGALPLISSKCRERRDFEKKNLTDPCSRPFDQYASVAFHIASEGELEQIRPLVDWLICRKERVEIVYTSESVEEKCQKLAKENLHLIRAFRLPLLSYFPFLLGQNLSKFISAKKLLLCRYDFYPELLLWGSRKDVFFILISAALKKRNTFSKPYNLYRKSLYGLFDLIVTSNENEKEKLSQLGIPSQQLLDFDFRKVQILKRVENAQVKLNTFDFFPPYRDYLEKFDRKNRMIIGSAWHHEMDVFKNPKMIEEIKEGRVHFLVAPHRLQESFIKNLQDKISSFSIPCYQIDKNYSREKMSSLLIQMEKKPGVLFMLVPGILCELYTLFLYTLVGGGFGKSVHSLLEPYLAGNRIYCGFKVHRSTEHDFIKKNNPHNLFVMKDIDNFFDLWRQTSKKEAINDISKETLYRQFEKIMERLILLSKGVGYA